MTYNLPQKGLIYSNEYGAVYNIDTLELLKQLEDKSIDAILTDPPYGININKGTGSIGSGDKVDVRDYGVFDWDKERLSKDYFTEMFRVAKELAIFGANYYSDYSEYIKPSSSWIIWDKRCSNEIKNDFGDGELCYITKKMATRIYRHLWNGFAHPKENIDRIHPTQKPLAVCSYILSLFNFKEPKIILDPFSGSGVFGIAALKHNHYVIFNDINKEYAEKHIEILKYEEENPKLFSSKSQNIQGR